MAATSLVDQVTPYAKYPYEEQIAMKKKGLQETLDSFGKKLVEDIRKRREGCPDWFDMNDPQKGLQLEEIIQTDEPFKEGYRNKVEFTIGREYKTSKIKVGFNKGNISKGIIFVEPPQGIVVISKASLMAAEILEKIVIDSCLEPYDRIVNKGFWRIMLFRESKQTKQISISVAVSKEEAQDCDLLKQKLIEGFKDKDFDGSQVVALSLIYGTGLSGSYQQEDDIELLAGDSLSYQDILCGYRFLIHPYAFFQVNSHAFEKMLALIGDWAGIQEGDVLFDICCGTGAIGICLQEKVSKLVGIEMVEKAIENAKENVKLNKERIPEDKCEFLAGRAEDLLPDVAKRYTQGSKRIIGIVDPPRSGLHGAVLKALRTCKGLDRLVYVSCNASSMVRDMSYLCGDTTKKRKAPPFKPIKAIGCDLFPHTPHVECITLFERFYGE